MKNSLLLQNSSSDINYCPQMKLWRGNVFTPVCHSVHRNPRQTPPRQTPPARHPLGRIPRADTHQLVRHPPETATAADGTYPTGMNSS